MIDRDIALVFDGIRDVVLEKNRRYGNSALDPPRVFSTARAGDGIRIRLDDKLARVKNSGQLRKNDVADLMGYLGLLCISEGWTDFIDLLD